MRVAAKQVQWAIFYLFFCLLLAEWTLATSMTFSRFSIISRGDWTLWVVLGVSSFVVLLCTKSHVSTALVVVISQLVAALIIAISIYQAGEQVLGADLVVLRVFQEFSVRLILVSIPYFLALSAFYFYEGRF